VVKRKVLRECCCRFERRITGGTAL